jgi:glycosyltransferase involved in cell wall biosynthesis
MSAAMKNEPAVNYIFMRMAHHAGHAGYDRLLHYAGGSVLGPNRLHRLLDKVPERVLANLRRTAGAWYNSRALKQELQNIPAFLFKAGRIYHFLYGEDSFHYSGYFNPRRSNKLVATYHMPPQKFSDITRGRRHLKTLDAVVVLAPNQEDLFKNLVPPERVHLIPHGVDTRYFRPQEQVQRSGRRCIFVGVHMRNFKMLRQVIQRINEKEGDIAFTVITFEEHFHHFNGLRNVSLYSSISEDELLGLYGAADVLLMPMHDCTANNAVLEAMACGLPVVATRVGGLGLYVNDTCAVLVDPEDVQGMADAVLALITDKQRLEEMSRGARNVAQQFDWKVIAEKMQNLYKGLLQQ